jgi:glycosyltransferase involved in cell wall biosynthesis
MRLGLNMLFMVPGQMGGLETYARGLVDGLRALDSRNEYVILANRENAAIWGDGPPNFAVHVCPVWGTRKVARTLFEQWGLNRLARRTGIDLLHSPGQSAPPPCNGIRSAATIGDLIFRRYPDEFAWAQRVAASYVVARSARRYERILTFSEFSKRDIAAEYGIALDRIDVTLLGCKVLAEDPGLAQRFFDQNRICGPFIFSVLSTYHHKNLGRLLAAVRILRDRRGFRHRLLVVGLRMAGYGDFVRQIEALGLREQVTFLGWAPDPALRALYSRADCFVFPSLYEGFGLPVLEALALGTPVACSNAASLPEVAGDAAELFDPHDPEAIAEAIRRCLEDDALRRHLMARGRARAAQFTWERCAELTLQSYRRLGAD